MITFFGNPSEKVFAVQTNQSISTVDVAKLSWLFGNRTSIEGTEVKATFIGPRAAMITPWSTNAVEITQNMAIEGIVRIEEFQGVSPGFEQFDPMLSQKYSALHQEMFTVNIEPVAIQSIEDIGAYNESEGLALNQEEIEYLEGVAQKIGRKLTDSEVFGFSQVNSEHCRHKIFNGTFIIDGEEKPTSLFKLIKETSKQNPNGIVSAYKDNVAFVKGPKAIQFAPKSAEKPDFYETKEYQSVISIKAETHNFPTTVEPFNGAATGSGGEIRDRLAGGKGSLPLAASKVLIHICVVPSLQDKIIYIFDDIGAIHMHILTVHRSKANDGLNGKIKMKWFVTSWHLLPLIKRGCQGYSFPPSRHSNQCDPFHVDFLINCVAYLLIPLPP